MSWEVKVLGEFEREVEKYAQEARELAVERLDDAGGGDIEDYLTEAIDDVLEVRMIHYADYLAAVQAYGKTREAFGLVYDDLRSDIYDRVLELGD